MSHLSRTVLVCLSTCLLAVAGSPALGQCLPGPVVELDKLGNLDGGFPEVLPGGANLGASVAALGDLDGDGVGDIAVGLPHDNGGGGSTGSVWVLFLNADKTVRDGQKLTRVPGGLLDGLAPGDWFGHSVAAIGDVDGDGVVDLAVGAPADDDTGNSSGSVWIVFLETDGTARAARKISGNTGGFTGLLQASDWFSYACVGGLGDLDGDGTLELGVGAYGDDDGGGGFGALWILSLDTDGTVAATAKISATSGGNPPPLDGGAFGHAVSALGDLDGDGVTDIAVGNVLRSTVWILFLNGDGSVRSSQEISNGVGGMGALPTSNFGRSLTSLGDVTGDGLADLLVGATTDDDGAVDAGAVWLLSLTAAGTVQEATRISSTQGGFAGDLDAADQFGRSVAALGDLDGDGQLDVVVGAHGDDDGAGNAGALWFLDLQRNALPPTITCPADVLAECASPFGTAVSFPAPLVSSGCDTSPVVTCVPPSGGLFPPGITTVTCSATDLAGNTAQCSFDVTVVDSQPPVLTCPADMLVECTSPAGAVVSFAAPAVSDACDLSPVVVCAPPSGSLFPPGTTTVTCSATDAAGNLGQCSFDVTVADQSPPRLSCPPDVLAECTGSAGSVVSFPTPTASDDCDPAPVVTCLPPSGSSFAPGTTSVLCTATDAAGNTAQCSFDVVVADSTAPDVTCPADLVVECSSPAGAEVSFSVTASDVCDPAPDLACVPPSGSDFPLGTTSVTCTATDAAGNAGQCSFDVTVVDTTPPSISCPPTLAVNTESPTGISVAFDVAADDLCDPDPVVVCTPPSGSLFPPGTTPVLCTATDALGNSSQCSFDVVVSVQVCQPDLGFGGSTASVSSVEGDSAFDALTYVLDFVGDVDGDGRDDVAVGHSGNDDNGDQSGSLRVYSGATAALLFEVDGAVTEERLGTSVDGTGDVDGDGVPDVIVGATRVQAPLTGYALVVSGGDGSIVHTLSSPLEGARYGTAVSGLGDLDFDGRAEFAVGACQQDLGGPAVGRVTIHAGLDAAPLLDIDGDADNDWSGYALCAAGDVDGDGIPDLAVGAPQMGPLPWLNQATGPGRVRIHSGLDGSLIQQYAGDLVGDRYGFALDAAGDLDLDGVPDLIIGAPVWNTNSTPGRGYAQVRSGATGAVLLRIDGTGPDDYLGASVAGGGDIDGDGVPDVVVGALYADVLEVDSGRAVAVSGADGAVIHATAGAVAQDLNGFAVAAGGDLDGDGLSDLLVTTPFHDGSDINTGRIQGFRPCDGNSGLVNPCNARISLCGDDLTTAGSTATFEIVDGEPFAPVFLILGLGFNPTPLLGSTLVPFPWASLITGLTLDANGALSLPVPGTAGTPVTVFVQAILPTPVGFEFTNALAVEIGI